MIAVRSFLPRWCAGDPICDCFALRLYQNGAIFCVCDGCGWGNAAVEAARITRSTFMQGLQQNGNIVASGSLAKATTIVQCFAIVIG